MAVVHVGFMAGFSRVSRLKVWPILGVPTPYRRGVRWGRFVPETPGPAPRVTGGAGRATLPLHERARSTRERITAGCRRGSSSSASQFPRERAGCRRTFARGTDGALRGCLEGKRLGPPAVLKTDGIEGIGVGPSGPGATSEGGRAESSDGAPGAGGNQRDTEMDRRRVAHGHLDACGEPAHAQPGPTEQPT